jgi:carbonic anhydrase
MESAVYESSLPWDPARPDTVIISCVDGRWFRHFEEFARLQLKAGARTDYLAVPGGIEPMTLFDLVPKDFNFFRRRIEGLVAAHGTKRIVAIAHQDCAWYKTRMIGPLRFDMRERQITDLRSSAERLRQMFPGVTVETYYARHNGADPERVVFEVV